MFQRVTITVFCLFLAGLLVSSPALAAKKKAAPAGYCAVAQKCASLVIDGRTGAVLSSHDPDKRVYPASLTKMMTLYLLFEAIEQRRFGLNDSIRISANAAAQSPTKIGLEPGQRILVEDAIEAVAMKSANDIAVAVAEAVGGSESQFVAMMNRKAQQLGMTGTQFRNPSGLPNSQQVTTARDMVTLARRLVLDFPHRKKYLGLRSANIAGRVIHGHNRLLNRGECTGGKTGYIQASGFNLAAWQEKDGALIIGAVFGGSSISARDTHMATLLRQGVNRVAGGADVAGSSSGSSSGSGAQGASLASGGFPPRPPSLPAFRSATGKAADLTAMVQALEAQANDAGDAALTEAGLVARGDGAEGGANASVTASAGVTGEKAGESGREPEGASGGVSSFSGGGLTFDESWVVQVGAYRDVVQAQRALMHVTRVFPVVLGAAFPRTLETSTPSGSLYRAQLVGLGEVEAKSVCSALTRQGMPCLAVPPPARSRSDGPLS